MQTWVRGFVESLENRELFAAHYEVKNLIGDADSGAPIVDANSKNAWGIDRSPNGAFVVANTDAGKILQYRNGKIGSSVVDAPTPDADTGGTPNGLVFVDNNVFKFTQDGKTSPARYLACTEDGTILAWNDDIAKASGHAEVVVDDSDEGAVYKGIALGKAGGKNLFYAVNFAEGKIEAYDKSFDEVTLAGKFRDRKLPEGFVPFNIKNLDGKLYVTYAKKEEGGDEEVAGAGLGAVDVFNTNGQLLKRLTVGGSLNAPWGLELATDNFGKFSGDLLVGNFGDGKISAFDPETGKFQGRLKDDDGKAVVVDGLWGLSFGNGGNAGPKNALFFAAGPREEEGGLFGKIVAKN